MPDITTRQLSDKVIGRLTLYRRALREIDPTEQGTIFSHDLAKRVGVSSAQLRRDLMPVGYEGSPNRGYDVQKLLASLSGFLDGARDRNCLVVGVGNLGKALMAYFTTRNPNVRIVGAIEADPKLIGRIINGCRIYGLDELEAVVLQAEVTVAALAVPREAAQDVANRLVHAGVKGLLNFAPVHLDLPGGAYVENVDLTRSLEVVACFANQYSEEGRR